MRRNSVNSASGIKLWQFDNTVSEFWAHFHRICAETAI